MFKVTYEFFGCPESFVKVFQSREETNQFIGLHHECFSMVKVTEIFH